MNKEKKKRDKILWEGVYITLWKSGYIGVSDGCGYLGEEKDLEGLFKALKNLLTNKL